MKKFIAFTLFIGTICSCGNDETVKNKDKNTDVKSSDISVESLAERHIESKLSIPGTEKYTYQIYKEHLDGDDKIDAIITVNRLEFAMEEASESNKTAKRAEVGFLGNYNYIFFYDGGLGQISPPIVIASSPKANLKISFENISSDAYKDILVDFRILNASYKDFYSISNHFPERIFQWKNFDGLKTDTSTAFYFEYTDGTLSPIKDILVKKAEINQPKSEFDIYSFEPELKKTDELVYRFFYHPKERKYMTQRK